MEWRDEAGQVAPETLNPYQCPVRNVDLERLILKRDLQPAILNTFNIQCRSEVVGTSRTARVDE
jgi:hypothetical protein